MNLEVMQKIMVFRGCIASNKDCQTDSTKYLFKNLIFFFFFLRLSKTQELTIVTTLFLRVFLNFVLFHNSFFCFIGFWFSSLNLILFLLLLIYFWVDCSGSLFGIDNTCFNFYQLTLKLVNGCSKRATSKCWDIDS